MDRTGKKIVFMFTSTGGRESIQDRYGRGCHVLCASAKGIHWRYQCFCPPLMNMSALLRPLRRLSLNRRISIDFQEFSKLCVVRIFFCLIQKKQTVRVMISDTRHVRSSWINEIDKVQDAFQLKLVCHH